MIVIYMYVQLIHVHVLTMLPVLHNYEMLSWQEASQLSLHRLCR